jgi:hypothetical protein
MNTQGTTRAADIPALASKTKGAIVAGDVTALLKARNTALWLSTVEESRALDLLQDAAAGATLELRVWDFARGITNASGRVVADATDPTVALDYIAATKDRALYVLLDFHKMLPDPKVQRQLKNLARQLESAPKSEFRAMCVLSYSADVAPELTGCVTLVELPLPDRAEIGAMLDTIVSARPDMAPSNGARDAAIGAACGLTLKGAENCFAKSFATTKSIDPAIVAGEKRRLISGVPGLEWLDVDPRGLGAMGGGDLLKPATALLALCYSPDARAYDLPMPKGYVVVGPPGTGKTLFAKCVAAVLGCPLLRGDLNATAGKFVGDSEKGIRRLFATVDAVGRCVLLLDEIEKMFSSGPAGADGGVSADRLGQFLSWRQESKSEVFVIATANDVSALPPEMLRKGRFDDVWFLDLPTQRERVEVVRAALGQYRRDASTIDAAEVARACAGFVGAEIASLVPSAMLVAFADGKRAITTADLVAASRDVVPLSKTAGEKIDRLRAWAKGRARPASTPEETSNASSRLADL